MSTDFFYPVFSEGNLKIIIKLAETDPGYLEHADCPYAEYTKKILRAPPKGDTVLSSAPTGDTQVILSEEEIICQLSKLCKEIQEYGTDVKFSDKSTDKNTYFRLSVTLLERIILLKEKMSNIKLVDEFILTILQILEEELTPDQRGTVLGRLNKYQNPPASA